MWHSYSSAWGPARAQPTAAKATEAGRWLSGVEANGHSDSKTALLEWGLTLGCGGGVTEGWAWCPSERPGGPLKSHAWSKPWEHVETLEDLAAVMGYVGSGGTCITCPSVFLVVNWSEFSASCSQVPQHAGLWACDS